MSLKDLKVEDLKEVYDFEYVNPARDSKSNRLIHHFSLSPKSVQSPKSKYSSLRESAMPTLGTTSVMTSNLGNQ